MAPRRKAFLESLPSMAAEVLEVRSLLSAGTALAHHVQHVAELQITPDKTQHPAVSAEILQVGALPWLSTGTPKFSISSGNLKPGSSVHAKINFALPLGKISFGVSGSVSAKVVSSSTVGSVTELKLTPTGGEITLNFKNTGLFGAGKLKYISTAADFTLDLDAQGQFLSLQGDFALENHPTALLTLVVRTV